MQNPGQKEPGTFDRRKEKLCALLGRRLRKARAAVRALERSGKETRRAEELKKKGELLKANYRRHKRGMKTITVTDVFNPAQPAVKLALNPRFSPEKNLEACFKKYKKYRRGARTVAARLAEKKREAALFAAELAKADGAESEAAIKPLEKKYTAQKKTRVQKKALPYREFASSDGFRILVGKSARANDRLTFVHGRAPDVWLHTDACGGSHVLIKCPKKKTPPRATLVEAANLAVFFSRARAAGRAAVVYTKRGNVRKSKAMKPGEVSVSRTKTLHITLDRTLVRRLGAK